MPIVLEKYGEAAYKRFHQLTVAADVAAENDSDADGIYTDVYKDWDGSSKYIYKTSCFQSETRQSGCTSFQSYFGI